MSNPWFSYNTDNKVLQSVMRHLYRRQVELAKELLKELHEEKVDISGKFIQVQLNLPNCFRARHEIDLAAFAILSGLVSTEDEEKRTLDNDFFGWLIEHGNFQPDECSTDGSNWFHYASWLGDAGVMKRILSLHPGLQDKENLQRVFPYIVGACTGVDIVHWKMGNSDPKVSAHSLAIAYQSRNLPAFHFLLSKYPDFDINLLQNELGRPLVHCIVSDYGNDIVDGQPAYELLSSILDAHPDQLEKVHGNKTPLLQLAMGGSIDSLETFIYDFGANWDPQVGNQNMYDVMYRREPAVMEWCLKFLKMQSDCKAISEKGGQAEDVVGYPGHHEPCKQCCNEECDCICEADPTYFSVIPLQNVL